MSIANELSSEVATAIFTRQAGQAAIEPKGSTKIVLEVHSTLRRLMADARQRQKEPIRQSPTDAKRFVD